VCERSITLCRQWRFTCIWGLFFSLFAIF